MIHCHHEVNLLTKPPYTYNALYILASSGFCTASMVINSIMSQSTIAMGFYTRYFGHMTNYTCMPNEYPCGFVLSDDQLSSFDDWWWISQHDFVYILSNSQAFHSNQSDFMKQVLGSWLSWRPSIFKQKVHQLIRKLQTSSIHQWWPFIFVFLL